MLGQPGHAAPRPRPLALATAALTALLVAGCSGTAARPVAHSSSPPSASGQPPTVSAGSADNLPAFPTSEPSAPPTSLPTPTSTAQEQAFITSVFTDVQNDWKSAFTAAGAQYVPARLDLFTSQVNTGCGAASSTTGPFYCPADDTVYLDVTFFDDLEQRFGLTGDFAQAYAVAHEMGHHIQNITGITAQVTRLEKSAPAQANAYSIRVELQADCYAGVWAHSAYSRHLLDPGDLDEALTAAATVGDDFLQRAATGSVDPEQWTHGTSTQRQQWLTTGYDTGSPAACDTFTSAK